MDQNTFRVRRLPICNVGGVTYLTIPDEFLTTAKDIDLFIYLSQSNVRYFVNHEPRFTYRYAYIYIYNKFTEASHHNTLHITQNRWM